MIKAIFAKEVRVGDVILLREERRLAVESAWRSAPLGYIQFNGSNGVFSLAGSDEIVGLLHRPYPEGETAHTVRCRLAARLKGALIVVEEPNSAAPGIEDDHLAAMRETLDEFELGKPLAREDKQVRPEAEASSGYLGGRCV